MRRREWLKTRWTLSTAVLLVTGGLTLSQQISHAQQSPGRRVDDAALRNAGASGEEWLTYGLDPGEKRYSPLTQIDATNVTRLGLAWSFDIPGGNSAPPGGGNQEATLLASNGVALRHHDLERGVRGRCAHRQAALEVGSRGESAAVQSKICCGVVNRGVALYEGKVIAPIIDGRLVALDASTGKPVWEARVAYPQDQYTLTMAPRIAKGKVHRRRERIGVSGARFRRRVRRQHRPARVALLHRARRSVEAVRERRDAQGRARRGAASGTRWAAARTVWDGMAYDPQANLIYFGTGNGGPWPEVLRGSQGKDNLYVCSIIAVNPDNGEMKWYYQAVPGDSWDYDAVQQLTLADLTIDGRPRTRHHAGEQERLLLRDRSDHRRVHFGVAVRAAELVRGDGQEDRPAVHPPARVLRHGSGDDLPGPDRRAQLVADVVQSADRTDVHPDHVRNSSTYTVNPDTFVFREGGRNTGIGRGNAPGPPAAADAHPGTTPERRRRAVRAADDRTAATDSAAALLIAWDPVTQKERWRREGGGASGGGTVTTAGNLVLQVRARWAAHRLQRRQGREAARDSDTGLRQGMGPPITYMVDGKQYVTLMGGRGVVGGAAGGRGRRSRNRSRCGAGRRRCGRTRRRSGPRPAVAAENSDVRARRRRAVKAAAESQHGSLHDCVHRRRCQG